jgi:hypothetical protein
MAWAWKVVGKETSKTYLSSRLVVVIDEDLLQKGQAIYQELFVVGMDVNVLDLREAELKILGQ